MRALAATKAGRVLFRPTAHHLDQLVSRLTGGKRSFAGLAAGLPTVILTTTGAKSGKARTVALLGIPHPDGVAVVATNYGGAKHPAWYHDLKANPAAAVTIEGDTWHSIARPATPRERDEISAKGVELYPALCRRKCGPAIATSRRSSLIGPEEDRGQRPLARQADGVALDRRRHAQR